MILTKSYGLQKETRQYLKRLYAYGRVLEASDIIDIDNFIAGCKQLNLWQNIVCWPMRSIHNIGSSANVLSLGGLGIFDATLLNSATWSSDGVNRVTSSGNLFNTTVKMIDAAPVSYGSILKNATDLGNNSGYWFTGGVNNSGRQFAIGNSGIITGQNMSTYVSLWPPGIPSVAAINVQNASFSRTSRHYFSIRLTSGTTGRFSLNNSQTNHTSSGSDWNGSNPQFVRFGAYNVALNLTASFVFLTNSIVTDSQDASLYSLIKATIGKGLGLP